MRGASLNDAMKTTPHPAPSMRGAVAAGPGPTSRRAKPFVCSALAVALQAEKAMTRFKKSLSDDAGQTFIEYALLLAVVVVGVRLATTWTGLSTLLQTAMGAVTGAV